MLVFAMASIQLGASVAKQLFPLLGPFGTTLGRLGVASVLMMIIWRPWRAKMERKDVGIIALYSAALGCMNLLFYLALARIPLGITVALEFMGPLLLALLLSRKVLDYVWAVLATLGVILVMPVLAHDATALDPVGIGMALGAGFFWALYIIFGTRASGRLSSGPLTAFGILGATLVVLPLAVGFSGPIPWDWSLAPQILAVAIMSSALPYTLDMIAMKQLSAKTFGILMSLEPAVAAMSGKFFLHEILSPQQWLAIVFIIAASAGSTIFTGVSKPEEISKVLL